MNQKMKYIGLFAILPLAMIALAPELVDMRLLRKLKEFPVINLQNPMDQQPMTYYVETVFAARLKETQIQ